MNHIGLYVFCFGNNQNVKFRLINEKDSLEELTRLLNKSYKSLADMGLKYVASWQDSSITLKRIETAYKSYVGICNNKIVSTISMYLPKSFDKKIWYENDFVAKLGQFAVLPELQNHGIGSRMLDIVEYEARQTKGIKELALDTAETAYHLIDYYKKRGYRYIETISWESTNYNSVILSKNLK